MSRVIRYFGIRNAASSKVVQVILVTRDGGKESVEVVAERPSANAARDEMSRRNRKLLK